MTGQSAHGSRRIDFGAVLTFNLPIIIICSFLVFKFSIMLHLETFSSSPPPP